MRFVFCNQTANGKRLFRKHRVRLSQRFFRFRDKLAKGVLFTHRRDFIHQVPADFRDSFVISLLLIRLGQRFEHPEIERLPGAWLTQKVEKLIRFLQFVFLDLSPGDCHPDFRKIAFAFKRLFVEWSGVRPASHLFQVGCESRAKFRTFRILSHRRRAKRIRFRMHVIRQKLGMCDQRGFNSWIVAVSLQCPRDGQLT